MVDSNKPPEGGGFGDLFIAGIPLGGTVGYSIWKEMSSIKGAAAATPGAAGHPVFDAVRNFAQSTATRAPIGVHHYQQFLRERAGFTGTAEGARVARTAFLEAAQTLPKGVSENFQDQIKRVSFAKNTAEINRAIQSMFENESAATSKLFTSYRQHLAVGTKFYEQYGRVAEMTQIQTNFKNVMEGVTGKKALPELITADVTGGARDELAKINRLMLDHGGKIYQKIAKRQELQDFAVYQLNWMYQGKDISVNVPRVVDGMMMEGGTLSTRRFAPQVWVLGEKGVQGFDRDEFFLRRVRKEVMEGLVAGDLSEVEAQSRINKIRMDLLTNTETVSNVPLGINRGSFAAYSKYRRGLVDILVEEDGAFRTADWQEIGHVMGMSSKDLPGGQRVFGGVGLKPASMARLSTIDPSQWTMFSAAQDWGRRPESGLRIFGLSEKAVQAGGRWNKNKVLETAAQRELLGDTASPHLRTLFLSKKQYAGVLQDLGVDEGEFLISSRARKALQQEYLTHLDMKSIEKSVLADIEAGKDIAEGRYLGRNIKGKAVRMKKGMSLLSTDFHQTGAKGDFATLIMAKTHNLRQIEKWFGDIRGMGRLITPQEMREAVGRVTGRKMGAFDILATTEEMLKNPAMAAKQMHTGIFDVFQQRQMAEIRAGKQGAYLSRRAQAFLEDPLKFADRWQRDVKAATAKGSKVAGAWSNPEAAKRMMRFALEERMTPAEFRRPFGSAAEILGDAESAKSILREVHAEVSARDAQRARDAFVPGSAMRRIAPLAAYEKILEEEKTWSVGLSQISWGGPSELRGAGVRGSLEPRILEQLTGSHWGDAGATVKRELEQRLMRGNVHKLEAHREITKTLQSLSGELAPPKGAVVETALSIDNFQDFMKAGGGWMRLGHGQGTMYVPNAAAMDALQPFTTPGGTSVYSDISRIYSDIYRTSRASYGDDAAVSQKQLMNLLDRSRAQLYQHWAPGGKGAGAYLRGKGFQGSRFLEVASKVGNVTSDDPFTGVIGRKHARKMARELFEQDIINKTQYQAMRDVISGKSDDYLYGMIARHPMFGQFSSQAMRFRVADIGDSVILPAMNIDVGFKEMAGSTPVSIGTLTGMVADKDGDITMAMLMGPDSSAKIKNLVDQRNNKYMLSQMSHTMRMQLIKASRGADSTTLMKIEEKMMADVQKQALSQKQIPLLSNQLSRARAAVISQMGGQRAQNARFLLEWLEQTPISAKHISAQKVPEGALSGMYATISRSFEKAAYGDEQAKASLMREINKMMDIGGAGAKKVGAKLLTDDLTLDDATVRQLQKFMGPDFDMRKLQGLNIQETLDDLFRSINEFSGTEDAKFFDALMGRARAAYGGTLSASDSNKILSEWATRTGRLADEMGQGAFSKVSRATVAGKNILAAAGRAIINNKKVVGFGFAGSLALGAVLSTPTKSLGPGSKSDPEDAEMVMKQAQLRSRSRAAERFTPDKLHPQGNMESQPTAPPPIQNTARIAAPRSQRQVRANVMQGASTAGIAGGLSELTGGQSSVNVSVRDSTATTTNNHILLHKYMKG